MPTAVRTTRRSRGRVGGSGAATLAPWGGAFIVEPMVDGGRECKRFVRLSLLRRVWLLRSVAAAQNPDEILVGEHDRLRKVDCEP